jgi:hypothetical protein
MLRVVLVSCIVSLGCSANLAKTESPHNSYFSDAADCYHSSELKQKINIPISARDTIVSTTVIEVPLTTDAGAFRLCMQHKGHPVTDTQATADDYLNQSRACLEQARASSNPNQTYSECANLGKITVESLPAEK